MSDSIIQVNQEKIHTELKDLVQRRRRVCLLPCRVFLLKNRHCSPIGGVG